MTDHRKKSLAYWANVASSWAAIAAVCFGIWRGGEISAQVQLALRESVSLHDMKDWISETAAANTNWVPAKFATIFDDNHSRRERTP